MSNCAVSSGHRLITDLTHEAASFVADQADGLLSVFVPHATAGVALIETGAGTEPDLADALERLLPTADIYRHRHGSLGHGRDHVMPAFVSPSLTIPVIGGRLALGTWQSVVLVDPNGDNPRRTGALCHLPCRSVTLGSHHPVRSRG
ncbi:MAG: YjbQ family protein [Micrococcales bacterium]|nr:YjbQ family protein [Micrococcales bacterium]